VGMALFADFSKMYIATIFRVELKNTSVHMFINFGPKGMVPSALEREVLVIFPCPTSL
jgi:hypothetical protein